MRRLVRNIHDGMSFLSSVDIEIGIQCLYKRRTVGDGTTRSEIFVISMNEAIIRFLRPQVCGLYTRSAAKVGLLYRVSEAP